MVASSGLCPGFRPGHHRSQGFGPSAAQLSRQQAPERVRRVQIRAIDGRVETVPVDAVTPLLAVDPPRELALAVVAAHIRQRQRRDDEETDMVAVDDERAHRRVWENGAGMTRRGMAVTSVGPVMTAPERPKVRYLAT